MEHRFSQLVFPENSKIYLNQKIAWIEKWNWNYEDYLIFLKKAQAFIYANQDHKIFIFCNHPHCFTLGRGNERGADNLSIFDESIIATLKYPVYKIHRGGGITFHYPGQWIFYPIVNISPSNTLDDLMCWMLRSVKLTLEEMGLRDLVTAKKLMGIWKNKQKLASIGLGLNRFVTEHGLALNLKYDEDMFAQLKFINPCGMDAKIYISADTFLSDDNIIYKFQENFKKKFFP